MHPQHPSNAKKEEVTASAVPLSQLIKVGKNSTYPDAIVQVTFDPTDDFHIKANDKYHTVWSMFLADKEWYKTHGPAVMHLFKSFIVCATSPRNINLRGNVELSQRINGLMHTRYMILPIVSMKMVDGQLLSMSLQGINSKSRSVHRGGCDLRSRDMHVIDVCLNKQWLDLGIRAHVLNDFFNSSRYTAISHAQRTAMGVAFESDGVEIEKMIESAFGENMGVFNEN